MRSITGYLFGALVLAVLGGVCVAAGMLDRQVVRAQQHFAALNYDEAEQASEDVERYFEYASWIPWIGRRPLNDVHARKAAMQYWRRQYDLVVPRAADQIGAVSSDNIELQLIVANAVYRSRQAQGKDRAHSLEALDAAINAYVAVLRNAGRHETAAYNYEFLVRLREDIDKGRRTPEITETDEDGPAGRPGGPPQNSNKRDFKILIPLEPGEMDKAIEPGKGTPIERKG